MKPYTEIGMKRTAGLVLLLVGTLVPLTPAWGQTRALVQDEPDGPAYLAGEVLVQFKPNASEADLLNAVNLGQLRLIKHIHTDAMKAVRHPGVSRLSTRLPVGQAIQALQNHPAVEFAEPNWVYTRAATANDPYFTSGSLWGMYGDLSDPANLYGSQAAEAWAGGYLGSKSVVVGVIDEGIQVTHPDLAPNIWSNPSETANGLDDDSNGYADDINGWDFCENNSSVFDGTVFDQTDYHGTHVAGTIGAVGGNSLGVVGVNWSVTLISGKFLGPDGGSTTDAIEAVDYFTALKGRGVNIVVLNNSWGGSGYSQALHDAIIRAAKANILFVAASGNGNQAGKAVNIDVKPYYPACYSTLVGSSTEPAADYDAVVSVTAIDNSGNKASFANYGATSVDLGAPGVSIWSTVPFGNYGVFGGTSMATPHVTGAISLYASTHPDATAAEIKQAILNATAATASLAGKTVTGGRLDLSTVVNAPPPASAPTAPSDLTANALSYSQIKLDWKDHADNESYFEITRSVEGTAGMVILLGANSTTYTDAGLSPETTYNYAIKACNAAGCSSEITVSATTPTGPKPASACFFGFDVTTQGNWINTYGADGYDIVKYKSPPDYGTVTPAGYSTYTWADPTSDVRAVQTPDGSSRFASCFTSFDTQGAFRFDLNFTDGSPHRVSLYCLDWDRQARQQVIEVVDRTYGNLLDSRFVETFGEGMYVTWDITGPAIIKVKWNDNPASNGDNAVVSGIFFDPVTSGDRPPTVAITSPATGETVSGTVTIFATASDDDQVTQVEFFANGTRIGTGVNEGADGWSAAWDSAMVPDGSYSLTAQATDNASQTTTSASVSVIVKNTVAATLHCGDLDGKATSSGRTWNATVTVTIHDGNHQPVSGATVTGTWSGGYSGTDSGTTGADGAVSLTTGSISKNKTSVTFTITGVTCPDLTYDPTDNHDPDGDSNGTSIAVLKP